MLERGRSLRGRVVDEAGAPVAGAEVRVHLAHAPAATESAADGSFAVSGLSRARAEARILVRHPDFAASWSEHAPDEHDGLELGLRLERGRELELFLVDALGGEALSGTAEVSLLADELERPCSDRPDPLRHALELDGGRLALAHLPTFADGLWLCLPGYEPHRIELGPAADRGERVALRPATRRTLELVDAATLAPVYGGTLHVRAGQHGVLVHEERLAGGAPSDAHRLVLDTAALPAELNGWSVRAPGYAECSRAMTRAELEAAPAVLRVPLARPAPVPDPAGPRREPADSVPSAAGPEATRTERAPL